MISYQDFEKVDIRTGRIIKVEDTTGLKNPSYKMTIDFGDEIGHKISIGQYTVNYTKEDLVGRQVLCVVNFEPKKIGHYTSEVLTVGFDDGKGGIVCATTERDVPLGLKMY